MDKEEMRKAIISVYDGLTQEEICKLSAHMRGYAGCKDFESMVDYAMICYEAERSEFTEEEFKAKFKADTEEVLDDLND